MLDTEDHGPQIASDFDTVVAGPARTFGRAFAGFKAQPWPKLLATVECSCWAMTLSWPLKRV